MKYKHHPFESGQAKIEYVLLISLISLMTMSALIPLAPTISRLYLRAVGDLSAENEADVTTDVSNAEIADEASTEEPESSDNPHVKIMQSFLDRINRFHEDNGEWPRSWGEHRYSDIGLNFSDWKEPVEGIYWNPGGDKIGLSNVRGDNLQVYVQDTNGNTLHLYDGYDIWCTATSEKCYYQYVSPENEVDINTLTVVEQESKGQGKGEDQKENKDKKSKDKN